MIYHGAWRVDQGTIDHESADYVISAIKDTKIKLFASGAAFRVTDKAIRVLGGGGIMREHGGGRQHHDALVYLFAKGTSDVRRNLISHAMKDRDLPP